MKKQKKPVLFTMKMKDEKEREKWQKYAKNRYGEPLSVVVRRLIEEDMRDTLPREYVKLEELFNVIREENRRNFQTLVNRFDRFVIVSTSKTYEFSKELEFIKGLMLNKFETFYNKNKEKKLTSELINKLKKDILAIIDEMMSSYL
ncbi:MAG: hypothetical protein ACTSO9_13325 [Candidatus Helarchaeota archaeon]